MKEEIEAMNSAIEGLFTQGLLSLEFKTEMLDAVKKASINVINKRYPDTIDQRSVKCACGKPDCKTGISFDSEEGDITILRFHYYLNNEIHMRLAAEERQKLIEHLT